MFLELCDNTTYRMMSSFHHRIKRPSNENKVNKSTKKYIKVIDNILVLCGQTILSSHEHGEQCEECSASSSFFLIKFVRKAICFLPSLFVFCTKILVSKSLQRIRSFYVNKSNLSILYVYSHLNFFIECLSIQIGFFSSF